MEQRESLQLRQSERESDSGDTIDLILRLCSKTMEFTTSLMVLLVVKLNSV